MPNIATAAGRDIKLVAGHAPVDSAAATITGTAIDRATPGGLLYLCAVLHTIVGAASGTPTSFSVANELQDSDDGSTGWADLDGSAITTLVADNTQGQVVVNLVSAKRWIRAKPVVAFVDGTTPKVEVQTTIALCGASEHPIS